MFAVFPNCRFEHLGGGGWGGAENITPEARLNPGLKHLKPRFNPGFEHRVVEFARPEFEHQVLEFPNPGFEQQALEFPNPGFEHRVLEFPNPGFEHRVLEFANTSMLVVRLGTIRRSTTTSLLTATSTVLLNSNCLLNKSFSKKAKKTVERRSLTPFNPYYKDF